MSEAQTVRNEEFQSDLDDATDRHLTAFYNPIKTYRENALREIRAKSGWSPEAWKELDAAAGIRTENEEGEIEAAAMPYRMGVNFAQDGLDEQFVQSTLMDVLAGSGFDVSASLSDYVYARPLKSGRMEADTAMNYRTESRQDLDTNGLDGVPLPVHIVTYEIDGREMEVRRTYGENPEARPAREARQALNRREHEVLYNGWGNDFPTDAGTFSIGGLDSTDTSRVLQAGASAGWQDPAEVLSNIDLLHETIETQADDVVNEEDVPLVSETGALVMVPRKKWGMVMRDDYESSATDEPLTERLNRKYPYINFVPAPRLAGDTAIMLLNDPRYFGIVNAQGVTNTAWDIDGGAARSFRVLSSRIPWVRAQPDGINGVARITGI